MFLPEFSSRFVSALQQNRTEYTVLKGFFICFMIKKPLNSSRITFYYIFEQNYWQMAWKFCRISTSSHNTGISWVNCQLKNCFAAEQSWFLGIHYLQSLHISHNTPCLPQKYCITFVFPPIPREVGKCVRRIFEKIEGQQIRKVVSLTERCIIKGWETKIWSTYLLSIKGYSLLFNSM